MKQRGMKDLKSLLQRSYIAGTSSITLRSFAYAQDDKRSSSLFIAHCTILWHLSNFPM